MDTQRWILDININYEDTVSKSEHIVRGSRARAPWSGFAPRALRFHYGIRVIKVRIISWSEERTHVTCSSGLHVCSMLMYIAVSCSYMFFLDSKRLKAWPSIYIRRVRWNKEFWLAWIQAFHYSFSKMNPYWGSLWVARTCVSLSGIAICISLFLCTTQVKPHSFHFFECGAPGLRLYFLKSQVTGLLGMRQWYPSLPHKN